MMLESRNPYPPAEPLHKILRLRPGMAEFQKVVSIVEPTAVGS